MKDKMSISLIYDLPDYEFRGHNFDPASELEGKLITARDEITNSMSGSIDLRVRHGSTFDIDGDFFVDFREKQPQSLVPALNRLFVIAGFPDFVEFGSGFPCVESELKKHGKRLQTRFYGAGAGKWVIDLKK